MEDMLDQAAQVNDINLDDGLIDGVAEMTEVVNLLVPEHEASKSPLMTDSSKLEVAEAGLTCNLGKCIGNPVSKKEGVVRIPGSDPLKHQPEKENYSKTFLNIGSAASLLGRRFTRRRLSRATTTRQSGSPRSRRRRQIT